MSSPAPARSYKETLNLPVTRFEMKANLTIREPALQKRWLEHDLYGQIRKARRGGPRRILHDGPPYANGEIHMGHLLNKVLKDLVVRSLTLLGYDSPYVPGWDCHGLPIEHKVMKELGSKAAGMTPSQIRKLCHEEALKWVNIQRNQFRRLGIDGDWENPYLTLDPRYEAGVLDILADLVAGGYVEHKLKPVHWCMTDRTALAEAELEYRDESTPSIYVNFPMVSGVSEDWGPGPWHALIWTTTPWTLPANVAIALHPAIEYSAIRYLDPKTGAESGSIIASALVEKVMARGGVSQYQTVGKTSGKALENAKYRHVFIDRECPLVLANYVTIDDGTGLVHTAPGHGGEDFQTGDAYKLETLSPVDAGGLFNHAAPEWLVGKHVFKANAEIVARLGDSKHLFHELSFVHSYPHCWRCKKPVIFRATKQWFVNIDHADLRGRTLAAIEKVRWLPDWGKSRIDAMVSGRPDWCISRQRAWGVPIPAFQCATTGCDELLLTPESVRHIRDIFRHEGGDSWYAQDAESQTPPGASCSRCGGTVFRKEFDILDVWFESGSSHRAVLDEPSYGLNDPAYLYLEGSDQHRGWFQSSILTAVASRDRAPFENVLTHGFIVDDQGKKQSKSEGNAISAVKATETYGADILRLYVSSLDNADDLRMSERGIKEMSEVYRKIRNTFRYLLGNLEDYHQFNPTSVPAESLHEIDRWILARLNDVIAEVERSYEQFEFYRVYQRIHHFCNVDLSSFYLDVLKDRLYAERRDGPDRRAAQFVMARLHDSLARLMAPIIPHTAEELWDFVPKGPDKTASVHLALMPRIEPEWNDPDRDARWQTLLGVRDEVLRELEKLRASKKIGSSQEAKVTLFSPDPDLAKLLEEKRSLIETLCIVSELTTADSMPEGATAGTDLAILWIGADRSSHPKCERCWNLRETVGKDSDHPGLCERCVSVVGAATQG